MSLLGWWPSPFSDTLSILSAFERCFQNRTVFQFGVRGRDSEGHLGQMACFTGRWNWTWNHSIHSAAVSLGSLMHVWKLILISLMETSVNILHLVGWLYWTHCPRGLKEMLRRWFWNGKERILCPSSPELIELLWVTGKPGRMAHLKWPSPLERLPWTGWAVWPTGMCLDLHAAWDSWKMGCGTAKSQSMSGAPGESIPFIGSYFPHWLHSNVIYIP